MALVLVLLGVQTYPGWFVAAIAILVMAWGTFLALNPVAMIELVHRGEEKSPFTRWWNNLWWNRWYSYPISIRIFGALMVVCGGFGLVSALTVGPFPK